MSRFRVRLYSDIEQARTAEARVLAELRLSIYLSRTGKTSEAESLIYNARREVDATFNQRVLALVNVAESVLAFFTDRYDEAFQKSRRAEAISSLNSQCIEVMLLAYAWRAHYEALFNNWPIVIELLERILGSAPPVNLEIMARVSMVAANALIEMNDNVQADLWYGISHRCALNDGDDATIEALIFNRAAARVQNLRLKQIDGEVSASELAAVEMEVNSAANYCQHTGIRSILWMLDLLRAQVAMLRSDYPLALELLSRESLDSLKRDELNAERNLEIMLCRARLGIDCSLEMDFSNLEAAASECRLESDKALQTFLVSQCHSAMQREGMALRCIETSKQYIKMYRMYQNDIRQRFQRIQVPSNY